jgi:serine/threonine protein kinase
LSDVKLLQAIIDTQAPMSDDSVRPLLTAICTALQAIHDEGHVHHDLKPSNIQINAEGEISFLNFGAVQSGDTSQRMNNVAGSAPYIAPELLTDTDTIDHRADIYALGAITYQMLTAQPPFSGSLPQLINAHVSQPPPDPRTANTEVSARLAEAVMKALAKAPEDRFDRVMDLSTSLQ